MGKRCRIRKYGRVGLSVEDGGKVGRVTLLNPLPALPRNTGGGKRRPVELVRD